MTNPDIMNPSKRFYKRTLALFIGIILILFGSADGQVNYDGTYSHYVPIDIPSGIKNTQPNLGLSYSSASGNGLIGVGWRLTGFPSIKRMSYGKGIAFDRSDAFVTPDGMLVKVAPGVYHGEYDSL
ncbi:MAG: hypothetical protein GY757_41170, partial [bacterium]|nr:hypothetical protein [bacterium]